MPRVSARAGRGSRRPVAAMCPLGSSPTTRPPGRGRTGVARDPRISGLRGADGWEAVPRRFCSSGDKTARVHVPAPASAKAHTRQNQGSGKRAPAALLWRRYCRWEGCVLSLEPQKGGLCEAVTQGPSITGLWMGTSGRGCKAVSDPPPAPRCQPVWRAVSSLHTSWCPEWEVGLHPCWPGVQSSSEKGVPAACHCLWVLLHSSPPPTPPGLLGPRLLWALDLQSHPLAHRLGSSPSSSPSPSPVCLPRERVQVLQRQGGG